MSDFTGRGSASLHNELVQATLLKLGALPFLRVWRQETGQAWLLGKKRADGSFGEPRPVRYGIVGGGDISGIITRKYDGAGLRLELDGKTGDARQSQEQVAFERMILKFGGAYKVFRTPEEAYAFVHEIHNQIPK